MSLCVCVCACGDTYTQRHIYTDLQAQRYKHIPAGTPHRHTRKHAHIHKQTPHAYTRALLDAIPGLTFRDSVEQTAQPILSVRDLDMTFTSRTGGFFKKPRVVKAVQKDMEIGGIRLTFKDGGKSGRFENP